MTHDECLSKDYVEQLFIQTSADISLTLFRLNFMNHVLRDDYSLGGIDRVRLLGVLSKVSELAWALTRLENSLSLRYVDEFPVSTRSTESSRSPFLRYSAGSHLRLLSEDQWKTLSIRPKER